MTRPLRVRQPRYEVVILPCHCTGSETTTYRAELWHRPFSGYRLAATRQVMSKAWARRDAARFLKGFPVCDD